MKESSRKRKEKRAVLTGSYVSGSLAVNKTEQAYNTGKDRLARHSVAEKKAARFADRTTYEYRPQIGNAEDIAKAQRAKAAEAVKRQKSAFDRVRATAEDASTAAKQANSARSMEPAAVARGHRARRAALELRTAQRNTGMDALIPNKWKPRVPRTAKTTAPFREYTAQLKSARGNLTGAISRENQAIRAYNDAYRGARTAERAAKAADSLPKFLAQKRDSIIRQGTERIMEAAGPKATAFQRAVVKTGDAVRGALSGSSGKLGAAAGRTAQALGLGTREAMAAAAGRAGGALTGTGNFVGGVLRGALGSNIVKPNVAATAAKATKAGEILGRSASAVPKAIAKGLVKAPTALFNTVEKAGQIVTAGNTGRAANLIRGATKASGLAGGFAIGAWTDAGMKAYDFYANGGKLSDVGARRVERQNGRNIVRNNPGWTDVVASKEFVKEFGKGLTSALTLGFAGNGGDTFLDRWMDNSPEEDNEKLQQYIENERRGRDGLTGKRLRTEDGKRAYSNKEIADRIAAENAVMDSVKAGAIDARKWESYRTADVTTENLRKYVQDAIAQRDEAFARAGDVSAYEQAVRSGAVRGGTKFDAWSGAVRSKAESDYQKHVDQLLSNKAAAALMEANRNDYYAMLHGANYDKAGSDFNGGQDAYRDFNRWWAGMTSEQRLTWDKNVSKASLDAGDKYGYESASEDDEDQGQNGGPVNGR